MRVIALKTGEEFISSLRALAKKEKLRGAWFWAIGGTDDVELAFYNLKKKRYITRRFRGRLEIVSLTGNIARKGKEVMIHAHGVFSRPNYATIGGHIIACRISATCEVYIEKLPALRRRYDPKTGLNLL